MEALSFPRGNVYMIINRATKQALKIKEDQQNNYEDSMVVATEPNPNDNQQLWMIENIKGDEFEIVNCVSSLVLQAKSDYTRLSVGKQKSSQLFYITKAQIPGEHQYYWIHASEEAKQTLALEGVLRLAVFDPNNENQLFHFSPVHDNYSLNSSALIINKLSGKALDVPGSTFDKGKRMIIWEKNKRFNQRWILEKGSKGYVIVSLLNGHALDIEGASRDPGAEVIQWIKTGAYNQQWFVETCEDGSCRFRSVHEPSLFLAVRKQDVDDGGQLQVHNQDNPSMYWYIEGKLQ